MVGNGQHSGNSWSTNNANGHIEHGPFLVKDDGFGPLINDLGQLVLVEQHTKMVCPSHSYIYRVLKQCRSIHESQCSVKICKQMPRGCSSCDTGLLMWDQVFGKLDISQSVDLGHDRGTSVSKGGF